MYRYQAFYANGAVGRKLTSNFLSLGYRLRRFSVKIDHLSPIAIIVMRYGCELATRELPNHQHTIFVPEFEARFNFRALTFRALTSAL